MLPTRTVLVLTTVLSIGFFPLRAQDPEPAQDEEVPVDPKVAPLNNFLQSERARIARELEGAWNLAGYASATAFADPNDFRSTMVFKDGYLSWIFMGVSPDPELIFFGDGVDFALSAGTYRYEVTQDSRLQLAAMMGFDYELEEVLVFQSGQAEQLDVVLEGDTLTLTSQTGVTYEYLRLRSSVFPEDSWDALQDESGGIGFDNYEDRDG